VRAVLLFLTGRSAGNRLPVTAGVLPISDASDAAPAKVRLQNTGGGWTVSAVDATVSLRVNGRLVRERLLRDGDFIGCGRSLYRLDLVEERPADKAPRRTIALQDVPSFAPRKKGLSTVVTAPGRWGNVFARWYGGAVLHLYGPADPHPDHLVARLGQRVRCHVLVQTDPNRPSREDSALELPGNLRVIALNDSENSDAAFIDQVWDSGAFFGVLSPLEPHVLAEKLRPLGPLLAYPTALRAFLTQAEPALVDGLRVADAGLLLSRSDGWELFCCPAMVPLARRLGLPEQENPARPLRFEDCPDGLTRISSDIASFAPSEIAAALCERDSLYLIVDAEAARQVGETLPLGIVPTDSRRNRYLLGPASGSARFDLIEKHWGRGTIFGVCSGREERSVLRLVNRLPERADLDFELPGNAQRDRLGGFEAILYDPADATWAVFADPQPKPVWQRYGLPAPVLGKSV
jgi:hypothetical protein